MSVSGGRPEGPADQVELAMIEASKPSL
jgi:hypothetical protein